MLAFFKEQIKWNRGLIANNFVIPVGALQNGILPGFIRAGDHREADLIFLVTKQTLCFLLCPKWTSRMYFDLTSGREVGVV